MEYINKIHKVNLPKDYPEKRGNIWFHINAQVDLETNSVTSPVYTIKTDHNEESKSFRDYHTALDYYLGITKP